MPQPSSVQKTKPGASAVTKENYLALAAFLEGSQRIQRVHKKEPHAESLRRAGEMYGNKEYVAAYDDFKPLCERVVTEMQRVLARNLDFEANKLAKEQRKTLSAAKESVQKMKVHAQEVIDQFKRLLQDLESKPLVRAYIRKGSSATFTHVSKVEEAPPAAPSSLNASELEVAPNTVTPVELVVGDARYWKAAYEPPEIGTLYSVRDKARGERIIRVVGMSPDRTLVQVETLDDGKPSARPIQLAVESLARQAAKGWCSVLIPLAVNAPSAAASASRPAPANASGNVTMRLDIQNFGRCCADINRANIRFDTQLIKDVGDGPFRAGNYEHAFLTFEQLAVGFTSAVVSSRQAIAEGRRALLAEKGKMSGKEIQERTAAFIRSEQLIHTAEREFSTILEGLRMYLRAQQG
jgi:hypothetical protein